MLRRQTAIGDPLHPDRRSRRDRGVTFIELLVAIVLLGTGVIAILVGLQTATTASVTDANHARAFAVLHDASDVVYDAPRLSCEVGATALVAAYSADLATAIDFPTGWSGANVEITNIEFLRADEITDPSHPDYGFTEFAWSPLCSEGVQGTVDYTNVPLRSQKVTIQVTSPDGLVKSMDTVKG